MRGIREHPIYVRVADVKLCIMARILVAAIILASVSIFLLVPISDCSDRLTISGRQSDKSEQNSTKTNGRGEESSQYRCGHPASTFSARIVDGKIGSIAEFP